MLGTDTEKSYVLQILLSYIVFIKFASFHQYKGVPHNFLLKNPLLKTYIMVKRCTPFRIQFIVTIQNQDIDLLSLFIFDTGYVDMYYKTLDSDS